MRPSSSELIDVRWAHCELFVVQSYLIGQEGEVKARPICAMKLCQVGG